MITSLRFAAVLAILSIVRPAWAERTLTHEAVITAPVADVWNAFVTNEGFESWAVAHAEIDLRVGGEIRSHYDPNGRIGDDRTIVNQILAFEPQRMLSIRNTRAPAGFPHADLFSQTWSVMYFEPDNGAADRTRVRIVGLGWGEGKEWDDLYAFFKAGNAQTLAKLQEKFAPNAASDNPQQVMALLGKLAGGEWIHQSATADGGVFRVRNVYEHGPDGKSLLTRGWLGAADGMFAHGGCLIWLEPGGSADTPGEVRFCNVDQAGSVTRGAIRLIGCDSVEWDWRSTHGDGKVTRHRVTMAFPDSNRYALRIDVVGDGGTLTKMVEADFTRVDKAPPEFLRMRGE
jgi:uncharacterized protein YndB with AHSA1/START domain